MSKRKPLAMKQTLIVPKGYENDLQVLALIGQYSARFGRNNVILEIEDVQEEEDPDAHDLAGRRSIRDPTDEDC